MQCLMQKVNKTNKQKPNHAAQANLRGQKEGKAELQSYGIILPRAHGDRPLIFYENPNHGNTSPFT